MGSEKVRDRIRKLLALGGNNPSEAEAAAAMEKAAALLVEYNLHPDDIGDQEAETSLPADGAIYCFRHNWEVELCEAAAVMNGCAAMHVLLGEYYRRARMMDGIPFQRDGRHTVLLTGRPVNREVTLLTTDYLIHTVKRLAKQAAENELADFPFGFDAKRFRLDFAKGCALRILSRAKSAAAEARKPQPAQQAAAAADTHHPTTGNPPGLDGNRSLPALRAAMTAEAEQVLQELTKDFKEGRGRSDSVRDMAAMRHGSAAADSVSLNRQVSAQRKLLGKS